MIYWIDAVIVRGNKEKITSEEHIVGPVEFVPFPDGTALLMRPIAILLEKNERNRKGGIMEIPPLSKMDQDLRTVLSLSKKEAMRVLQMQEGAELILIRKGWGKEWKQKITKLPKEE